jgi:hypothetical protein
VDNDHLQTTWYQYVDGEASEPHSFSLVRKADGNKKKVAASDR